MHTRPAGKRLEQLLREIPELLKATLGLVRRKRTKESGITPHFSVAHRTGLIPCPYKRARRQKWCWIQVLQVQGASLPLGLS